MRIVMTPGREEARVEPLCDEGFEFPVVSYRACSGRDYRLAWGARPSAEHSEILCVDVRSGKTTRTARHGFVFGEPIFVSRPGSGEEGDGVLLAVASHISDSRAAMAVLDARTLEEIAWAEVDVPIPLGFHGSFVRAG
jgi:carotenoid cleavage dioxygenase-like enzyme